MEEERRIPAGLQNKVKILVAEDNILNQKLLGFMLRSWGYRCEVCSNGKEAIEQIESGEYDLVLMDIEMPEMNGHEATLYLRNQLKSHIPVIAVTAHASAREKEKSIMCGMSDYISKPIKGGELFSLLAAYLFTEPITEEINKDG